MPTAIILLYAAQRLCEKEKKHITSGCAAAAKLRFGSKVRDLKCSKYNINLQQNSNNAKLKDGSNENLNFSELSSW